MSGFNYKQQKNLRRARQRCLLYGLLQAFVDLIGSNITAVTGPSFMAGHGATEPWRIKGWSLPDGVFALAWQLDLQDLGEVVIAAQGKTLVDWMWCLETEDAKMGFSLSQQAETRLGLTGTVDDALVEQVWRAIRSAMQEYIKARPSLALTQKHLGVIGSKIN